jgi:hypothetical protein
MNLADEFWPLAGFLSQRGKRFGHREATGKPGESQSDRTRKIAVHFHFWR